MLDETPERGEHGDCFQRLSTLKQQEVSTALTDSSPPDAMLTMQHCGMCYHCIAYYSYASLTIMFKRCSPLDGATIMTAASYALASVNKDEL